MPRPGPRPYECVRRAWHSDRHQPMRGSIIQQIFRLVTETHSPATKKNKEWQEKLPIVVLKSEEIMYSKANSEAEYTNLETLWDRANDAINTIIRRDESTETGELLPPCVEAALNLGCIAVRASRSQRHSNPRMYLSPRAQEPASVAPPRILDETNERCPQLSPLNSGNQLNYARGTTAASSARLPAESNRYATENRNLTAPHSNPLLYENIPQGHNQLMRMEGSTPLNLGSVYPLYYGAHCQTEPSRLGSQIAEDTNHRPIFLGMPVGTSIVNCPEIGILQNFFSCSSPAMVSRATGQADARDTPEKPLEEDCDLSLRLSLSSHPCMRVEKSSTLETEDVGSSSSEGGKSSMPCLQKNKEFSFFPGKPVGDPFDSSLGKWLSEGECHNSEGSVRKRKAPFSDNLEDSQFCSQPELPSNWFINRIKGPGL